LVVGFVKLLSAPLRSDTQILSLLPSWALPTIPVYEMGLGVWLLSGWMKFGAWLATLFTFLIFAIHNIELVTVGQSSCGCMGAVDVSPKFVLTLDVVLILLFLKRRQRWSGWPTSSPVTRQVLMTLSVMAGVLGTAAAIGFIRYGSLNVAVGHLRQETLVVEPGNLDVGEGTAGSVIESKVRIHNLTSESADLAYGKGSCSCAVFPDLPIKVPANGWADVRIHVRVSGEPGRFRGIGIFRTNVGHVRFGIRAWVVDTEKFAQTLLKE
jgi:hypothetical protein